MARLPGGGLRPRPVGLRPLVRPPRPRRGRRPRAGDGPRRERRRLAPLERRRPVGARRRTARRSRGVPGHHRARHQRPVRPGDPRRLDAAARADAMRVRVLALTLLLTLGPGPATAHDGSTGPPPAATLLPLVHAVEHATLLGTAVWLWWSATERRPAGALWLFTTAVHTSALGALLTLAPRPWFTGHHGGAGLTTLEDQQLAGLVMWVPAGTVLTGFALALLATWLRQAERRAPALARPPALVLALPLLGLALAGCDQAASTATAMTGGDPARGREAMPRYGCQTCHTIPGVTGADGTIGPPLAHLAVRAFIAGQSNSPEHLIAWIRHPQHVRPASAMPEMGVSEEDGRDIAAYLYTLR